MTPHNPLVSIVIPFLNEEESIPKLYAALNAALLPLKDISFEYLFVNDGSSDKSGSVVAGLMAKDSRVRYIEFTRNFGKEMATTAGLLEAKGDATIMIDADLQHPPSYIPQMLVLWSQGAEVVVGVRVRNSNEGILKRVGSAWFHALVNAISQQPLVHGETDFRLVDSTVIDAYRELRERQRMTRQLINWLGFRQVNFPFEAPARLHGQASYTPFKLVQLAITSFTRHSLLPLRLAGIAGVVITGLSFLLGLIIFINRYIFHDVLDWHVTGTSQLAVLNVFLIGLVLMALGLIALYIENIHLEVTGRPLYVIRSKPVSAETELFDTEQQQIKYEKNQYP